MLQLNDWQKTAILILLALAAIVSIAAGFKNSLQYSQDFQWSPSVLFLEGINPYTYYLNGNEGGRIILSQAPNYAHLTYIALIPFSLLNWEVAKFAWALTNLCAALMAVTILCKHTKLNASETLVVLFIFLCSTPLRNTIGNGQHSLIVLILFCALLLQKKPAGNLLIGIGYFKYSFMPPLFLYLLFSRGLRSALFSTLTCIIGWLAFSMYLHINPLETLFQPLKVSANAVGNGAADIMTIVGFMLGRESVFDRIAVYALPILTSTAFAWYAAKTKGDALFKLSLLSISSLITFKHLGYDFVFLLPAFVYSFKYRSMYQAKIAIGSIFFNWFALKIITPLKLAPEPIIIVNFLICIALAMLLITINKQLQCNSNRQSDAGSGSVRRSIGGHGPDL